MVSGWFVTPATDCKDSALNGGLLIFTDQSDHLFKCLGLKSFNVVPVRLRDLPIQLAFLETFHLALQTGCLIHR